MLLAHHIYEPDLETVLPKLRYPLIVQPKYDGFRVQKTRNGKLETRSGKRIYNQHLRRVLNEVMRPGMEGEVIYGNSFQELQQLISSQDTDFQLSSLSVMLFDCAVSLSTPYTERYSKLRSLVHSDDRELWVVQSETVNNARRVKELFEAEIALPYPRGEGLVLRDPFGLRLNKRSTLREQLLIAVKRREEDACECVGVVEQQSLNEERLNTLGAIQCVYNGTEFTIGTGFSDELRRQLWNNQEQIVGKLVKFAFLPVSNKKAPRQPVFLGVL